MKRRTVLIEDNHNEWIESNSINLSKYLRNKINEEISKEKNEN